MMMKVSSAVLLAASCVLTSTAQSSQTVSTPAQLPQIDVTMVDSSVSPCENFSRYVCSKLEAASPIPPDEVWWGALIKMGRENRQVLRQILEKNQAANSSRTPNEQKVGDFYATCMEQATSDANDLSAIAPLLERINAMHNKLDIAAMLAAMHSAFGKAWFSGDNQTGVALFGYGPIPDFNDVSRIVAGVDQGGLGLPGRDFYLKPDDDSKKIREQYLAFIASLLTLSGESSGDAAKDAAAILRVETAMAQAQMDNVTRRDPTKLNNRFTPSQLKALMPEFDWDSYQHAIHAPEVSLYIVTAPDFFRDLNLLLAHEDLATWKTYLRWHLLLAASPALGNKWRDAAFAFNRVLSGQAEQPVAWRRCTTAVDEYLGQALGQLFVEQAFPPESKARAQKMVKDIEAAMGRDIDAVSWMQPGTKVQAHQKLASVVEKIGYPDKWIDYSSLTILRNGLVGNVKRATAFEFERQLGFIGHPLDRTQWLMTPPTVDAYEDPQTNTINFPAGILQPPLFDPRSDDVLNYGAEGAVIGHELTHDFDDQGRKFDVKGNLRDWWTSEDAKQYEERGKCIAKEYTGPVPEVRGLEQNGKLTQGEDTADNGGLYLALSALSEDLKQQGKSLNDKDSTV